MRGLPASRPRIPRAALLPCLGSAGLLLAASPLQAQAVLHPNQIVGAVRFTNQNPEILAILSDPGNEGLSSGSVRAWSEALGLAHGSSCDLAGPLGMTYEVTVESSAAGVVYEVTPSARLDGGRDAYAFDPLESPPVFEEPSPDVSLDFAECAGLIRVRWKDEYGHPSPVGGVDIQAGRQDPGGGATEWRWSAGPGEPVSEEIVAVEGDDSLYEVRVRFTVGTDPFSDLITLRKDFWVPATCDRIVDIEIDVSSCTGGSCGGLGRILGRMDVLGEPENRVEQFSRMTADSGPWGNYRYDTILPDPSSGPFELENLVPSCMVSPEDPYNVSGRVSLREGRRHEWFWLPWLGGISGHPGVNIGPLETVDLGNTFVIDPGWVSGEVLFAGPPASATLGSCVSRIARVSDTYPGVPPSWAGGSRVSALGPTGGVANGYAEVEFEGSFLPPRSAFTGDYEIVLGGLPGEVSRWKHPELDLHFQGGDPLEPAGYLSSTLTVGSGDPGTRPLPPGTRLEVPLRYCFSQVNLSVRSTDGLFTHPSVTAGSGSFEGNDFLGEPADYRASLRAMGTTPGNSPSDLGLVVMCLPEGEWTVDPVVRAIDPGGGTSDTQLPPVRFHAGCRQIVSLFQDLYVRMSLPACVTASPAGVRGEVGSAGEVPRIWYSVNEGTETDVCIACGENPPYSFDAPLRPCDNRLRVHAEDSRGNVATTEQDVRWDGAPPAFACPPDSSWGGGGSGWGGCRLPATFLPLPDSAADDCDGPLPVSCDSPPYLPGGTTRVTCTARDSCGNSASCSLDVTVVAGPDPSPFTVDAGADAVLTCPAPVAFLSGTISGPGAAGYDARWEPASEVSDPDSLATTTSTPGTYTLTVTDRETGCTAEDSVTVRADPVLLPEPSALDLRPSAVPLRVGKAPRGILALSWEDSAPATASLYRGTIAALRVGRYDHDTRLACGIAGGSSTIVATPGSHYFLVAGSCAGAESSCGRDSSGIERPAPARRCP